MVISQVSGQSVSDADMKAKLQGKFLNDLYSKTYYSLVDRIDRDGFQPESLTGAYGGMFPRTTGAMVSLLIETDQLDLAQRTLHCVLKAITQNDMERIPRVIGRSKTAGKYEILDDQHQIDGQAHVIMAWARLAIKRGPTKFEDKTWPLVAKLMDRTCDRTFFQYGDWQMEPGLIRNIAFEHSRDGRMWDTWDLLTQCFCGAAMDAMAEVAKRRGDTKHLDQWAHKIAILKKGVQDHMTLRKEGKTVYMEMLLPNSAGGVPHLGMGWVTLSPIAAQWEPLDHQVMRNTVDVMRHVMLKDVGGAKWLPTDWYPDGHISNQVIGKGIGWEIDYARQEHESGRVMELLDLIEKVNAHDPLYMEGGWLDDGRLSHQDNITDEQLHAMNNPVWKMKDCGNGEQSSWWCWSMARLRKSVGLPAVPSRLP